MLFQKYSFSEIIIWIMNVQDFFGYGSCSNAFDSRRHINVIFEEFMSYKLYVNQTSTIQCVQYAMSLPEKQAAEYMCNDVLTYAEHNYLNLLRERYHVTDADFYFIMSGKTLGYPITKTPAGYNRELNLRLLVQMSLARIYMIPQNQTAFININTMIAEYARGMRGIQFSQSFITDLFSLINDAMFIYKDNYHLKEIEDYVIANIRA